jgi:hypothetical protein
MNSKTRSLAAGVIGALAFAVIATTAEAAPALGLTGGLRHHAGDAGHIAKVTWGWRRDCYWHHGYRYCSRGHRYYWRHYHRPWGWYGRWHSGRHSQY